MNLIKNILILACISGVLILHPGLNKGNNIATEIQHFVYGNSVQLFVNSEINRNKIKIVWESVKDDSKIIIYDQGKDIQPIPSQVGKQKVFVYYNNRFIGKIEHNKLIKNQAHKYNLSISAKNNSVFFKGEIIGPTSKNSRATTTLPLASL